MAASEEHGSPKNGNSVQSPPAHHVQTRFPWFGRLFDNPWETAKEQSLSDLAALLRDGLKNGSATLNGSLTNNRSPTAADYAAAFPRSAVDWAAFETPLGKDEIRCIWVGHATCLAKLGRVTFLTDPVFSQRASPVQFSGPKRVVQPAFEIDDPSFMHLDFVVISHCHYDHLDYNSVKQLHKKFGDDLRWFVPLKLKSWFQKIGIHNVVEMDWWEQIAHKDAVVTFVPAQHWSNRVGFSDFKRTLWGGWIVEKRQPSVKIWFVGDTGYCPVFKEIGHRFGPIDLSLIPIGAYDPPYIMQPQHTNPEEALQIHQDVQSRQSIGIHCCTFSLTLEPLDAPPRWLREAMEKKGLESKEFLTVCHGEMIQLQNQTLKSLPKTLPRD